MSISLIYLVSFILRIALLIYGEWQDFYLKVKFTDVDYFVFSDAAKFVALGETPYHRATYRYSPLLAWLLLPNMYFHKAWGKIMFIICDFLAAFFIQQILHLRSCSMKVINLSLAVWLFNPITMTVSCRGNAESMMSALVLGVIYFLLKKKIMTSACLFAISTHLKIYPVIYTLCIFLFLGGNFSNYKKQAKSRDTLNIIKMLVSKERLKFFVTSGIVFMIITGIMYYKYGFTFLEHSYLYHLTRRDIRHNFSVYFYMLYIDNSWWLSLLCFFNQFVIIFVISVACFEDLPYCFFLLTYVFVTFNKICTSQYFLWYLSLVPLLINGLGNLSFLQLIIPSMTWLAGQALWLSSAYFLEIKGLNTFLTLWLAAILFFVINVCVTCWFVTYYKFQYMFNSSGSLTLLKSKSE